MEIDRASTDSVQIEAIRRTSTLGEWAEDNGVGRQRNNCRRLGVDDGGRSVLNATTKLTPTGGNVGAENHSFDGGTTMNVSSSDVLKLCDRNSGSRVLKSSLVYDNSDERRNLNSSALCDGDFNRLTSCGDKIQRHSPLIRSSADSTQATMNSIDGGDRDHLSLALSKTSDGECGDKIEPPLISVTADRSAFVAGKSFLDATLLSKGDKLVAQKPFSCGRKRTRKAAPHRSARCDKADTDWMMLSKRLFGRPRASKKTSASNVKCSLNMINNDNRTVNRNNNDIDTVKICNNDVEKVSAVSGSVGGGENVKTAVINDRTLSLLSAVAADSVKPESNVAAFLSNTVETVLGDHLPDTTKGSDGDLNDSLVFTFAVKSDRDYATDAAASTDAGEEDRPGSSSSTVSATTRELFCDHTTALDIEAAAVRHLLSPLRSSDVGTTRSSAAALDHHNVSAAPYATVIASDNVPFRHLSPTPSTDDGDGDDDAAAKRRFLLALRSKTVSVPGEATLSQSFECVFDENGCETSNDTWPTKVENGLLDDLPTLNATSTVDEMSLNSAKVEENNENKNGMEDAKKKRRRHGGVVGRTEFICPDCGIRLPNSSRYHKHIKVHLNVRPFVCQQADCGKSFTRAEHLRRHASIHNEVSRVGLMCSLCGAKFRRKDQLANHNTSERCVVRPDEDNNNNGDGVDMEGACEEGSENKKSTFYDNEAGSIDDGVSLSTESSQHRDVHVVGDHRCTFTGCSKRFRWPNLLRIHVSTVHGERRCAVDGCETLVYGHKQLRRHMATQHSKYPVACLECGHRCKSKSDVKAHMETHKVMRVVVHCPYEGCGRFYYHKRNLATHYRTAHSKVQVFECTHPGCGRHFSTKQKLTHHLKLHDVIRTREEEAAKNGLPVKNKKIRKSNTIHVGMASKLSGLFCHQLMGEGGPSPDAPVDGDDDSSR